MINCNFNNTITERDMDLLLVEAIVSRLDFCRMLVGKTDLNGKDIEVVKTELSKADKDYGESDVTVILNIEGSLYGFLIEDKIDAIAMPDQHDRYIKRGDKGIKEGEYEDYRIFIFCPEKYYKNNDEAKLYEHLLTYEECKAFFDMKDDPMSLFWSQQLEQAITKAKKPPTGDVNGKANAFLRRYIEYQREHYPKLDLSTKEDKNGYWTDFRTDLHLVYINHKIQEGFVDLTFSGTAEKYTQLKPVAEWMRNHGFSEITTKKTGRSTIFRIQVPKIDMMAGFETVDLANLNICFESIKQLTDFMNMVETVRVALDN